MTIILTGKALDDFLKFHNQPKIWYVLMIKSKSYTILFSLIIEWLDNIDIICNAVSFEKGSYWKVICDNVMLPKKYKSRQEAINVALIKANEIYNSKN